MPHCELHYSDNLDLDAEAILIKVEAIINAHDADAHECKGRAYPAPVYHRTHLKVTVSLLSKTHRDRTFTKALMTDLETQIKAMLPQSCYFSLLLEYGSEYYVTNAHLVVGDDLTAFADECAHSSKF